MWIRQALICLLLAVTLAAATIGGLVQWQTQMTLGVSGVRAAALVMQEIATLSWTTVGAVLAWLRPKNVVAWTMLGVGALTQLGIAENTLALAGWFGPVDVADPWAHRFIGLFLTVVGGLCLYILHRCTADLLPVRAPARPSWRWSVALLVAASLAVQGQWTLAQINSAVPVPLDSAAEGPQTWLAWIPIGVYAAAVLIIWAGCVWRMLHARYPERQQLAWLFCAVVVLLITQLLGTQTWELWLQAIALHLLPVAIAAGILRYRMLGIEMVLRRGLVYAALTVAIVAVHAAVAALAGIRLTGAVLPAVTAAALVAIGVTPLRGWLQRVVDRLLYGHRSNPLEAVSGLADQVAGARREELLDLILTDVQLALRAAGVRVTDPDGNILASVGSEETAYRLPLIVSGSAVGTLELASRGKGEIYSRRDENLLRILTPQVAVVVHALHLASEVVAATTRERRRLRRDIHDDLGPSLTGVGLGLQGLKDAVQADQRQRGLELINVLQSEMSTVIIQIRRILADLGPVTVAEDGLAEAIKRRVSTTVSIDSH